jgi:iron complex outermembrane recepter protein
MMNMNFKAYMLSGAAVLALIPISAKAQSASPPQDTVDVSAIETTDIVVTANKREQNLNDVGLTVSAMGAEDLATQRVSNVADLARVTPGLVFAPAVTGVPVYTLRGVGFFESSLAAYPDVSLYLDQVPLSLPAMSTLTAFDLERVEVLKGPQGTLFGNNATGGAINFVAAKPTDELHAGIDLSYGRFNTVEVAGFVSGALSSTLRARLAVKVQKGDEWQKSYTRTGKPLPAAYAGLGIPANTFGRQDRLGKTDNVAARLIVDWTPSDTVRFSLNVNGWIDRNDPTATQKVANSSPLPIPPGTTGFGGTVPARVPILDFPNSPQNPRAAEWNPENRPYANNRFKQSTLRGDFDISDDITATSITGYSDLRFQNSTEGDGTPYKGFDLNRDTGHISSFTQELRLANGASNNLRWVLGGNYERTNVDQFSDVLYGDSTSFYANGISRNAFYSNQKMRNKAIFGNAEFDISPVFTIKGGIRQTWADRSTVNGSPHEAGTIDPPRGLLTGPDTLTQLFNLIRNFVPSIFGPNPIPIISGDSVSIDTRLNPDGTPFDPATYQTTGIFRGTLNERNTSFSVGFDVKPAEDVLLYGLVSKGYKAGSYPQISASIFEGYSPVVQESLMAYEVGFKTQFADRKVSVKGAAFYYDYGNKQLKAKYVDLLFGGLDKLLNVPKSIIKGAEIEVGLYPVSGLRITGAATYLDAKVDRYIGTSGSRLDSNGLFVPILSSFKGVSLPFSPKLQYSVRGDYDFGLNKKFDGFVGLGVSGQSKSIGVLTVSAADRKIYEINARALVDGTIGLKSSDDSWRLSIWGKNLFNKYYWTNVAQGFDTIFRYPGRGAEYGVAVAYKF